MLYENICSRRNEEAGSSKELERVKEGSIYVRESSRTIYERSKEHWSDWRSRDDKSHILRHQVECHEGDKTTLSRQIGEAVRIMKRGGAGAILNSKSEFYRCKFPRMILEDQDEEE